MGIEKKETIEFPNNNQVKVLLGPSDTNLKKVEDLLGIVAHHRGNQVTLKGDKKKVALAANLLQQLYDLINGRFYLTPQLIEQAVSLLQDNGTIRLRDLFSKSIFEAKTGEIIFPRSENQRQYIEAIDRHDCVFGIGPAGTGKSFLAIAKSVEFLQRKLVRKIVLTRPAVEAGEKLGFLPGTLQEKLDPYLRPLYDALFTFIGFEQTQELLEKNIIEIVPLAYMRGRTLEGAFLIVDEAQNTTTNQMKMCLTRLGINSKMVITGDITQIDLPSNHRSGLIEARDILKGIPEIYFQFFTEVDVVRHHLVKLIIQAYENH